MDSRTEWTAADSDLAQVLWDAVTDNGRDVLTVLMRSPGQPFSGEQLAAVLNRSGSHWAAGVFAGIESKCAALDRNYVWQFAYPAPGSRCVYWVEDEIADIFAALLHPGGR
ncbi:DUF6416 domain-containing protein [Nocardia sp. NPDC055053]